MLLFTSSHPAWLVHCHQVSQQTRSACVISCQASSPQYLMLSRHSTKTNCKHPPGPPDNNRTKVIRANLLPLWLPLLYCCRLLLLLLQALLDLLWVCYVLEQG